MNGELRRAKLDAPWGSLAGLVCALLVATVGHVHFLNLTVDDVFIPFRYAERLATGEGLTFNPGERVEGYSNFLWTVLLSLPAALGAKGTEFGMLWSAKLLGIGFNLGSVFLLWRLALLRLGQERVWATSVLPVYLAALAPFHAWGVVGLETALVTFLLMGALHAFYRESRGPASHGIGSAVWILLAALTRPEPVVLGGLFVGGRLLQLRSSGKFSWPLSLKYFSVFAVPYTAFVLFRLGYYGELLPNTYYAKLHDDGRALSRGLNYVEHAFSDLSWTAPAVIAVLVFVLYRRVSLWGLLVVGMFFVQLAGVVYEGGDWMPGYRMLVPAFPALCLCLLEVLRASQQLTLPAFLRDSPLAPRVRMLLRWGLPSMLSVLLLLGAWDSRQAVRVTNLPSGFERVQLDGFVHYEHARIMRDELEPGLLAIGEAGVVPYITGFPVIDMFGLTDAHIARQPGRIHSKFDVEYVLSRRPRYIYLLMRGTGERRHGAHPHARVLLRNEQFLDNYQVRLKLGRADLYERTDAPSGH